MADVGVRCEQNLVKSVSAANVTTPNYNALHTVLINVTLVNDSIMNLFQVGCYSQEHGVYVTVSVSNEMNSFTTHLRGLLSSSFYTCCTSATGILDHCQQYVTRDTCIIIKTPNDIFNGTFTQTESCAKALTPVSLVGGIFGFVIVVLLILLISLVCLQIPKRR